MAIAILFHFLCAQHVSDINIVGLSFFNYYNDARSNKHKIILVGRFRKISKSDC